MFRVLSQSGPAQGSSQRQGKERQHSTYLLLAQGTSYVEYVGHLAEVGAILYTQCTALVEERDGLLLNFSGKFRF